MSRKTKALTYSLKDRGRTFTGQDRSNVDLPTMIAKINSNEVQEMVKTKSLIGYYGHQIRQRFGMYPPESVIVDGKMVRLEPAIRTIEIHADSDGTVTHKQEFFNNEAGEFALKQYQANAGGFSTAVTYNETSSGKLLTKLFAGFDYVQVPNFVDNAGDGMLYDGLFVQDHGEGISMFDSAMTLDPVTAILAQSLERQIAQTFDSIHTQIALAGYAEKAFDQLGSALKDNVRLRDRAARYAKIRQARENERMESMVCSVRSFDSVIEEANQFLQDEEERVREEFDAIQKDKPSLIKTILPKWLGLG